MMMDWGCHPWARGDSGRILGNWGEMREKGETRDEIRRKEGWGWGGKRRDENRGIESE